MLSAGELHERFQAVTHEHTRSPVPEVETVGGLQIAMICMGITLTLPALYTGGELAAGLGLSRAVAAVVVGALLLGLMSIPAAVVGMRTRLSSYMIIEHVYGRVGAKLVNLGFGVVLLGWYALTAELFGRTLYLASLQLGVPEFPEWSWIVASSALVTATTLFGFKAIDRLALFAVPLLALLLVGVMTRALQLHGLAPLLAIAPGEMRFSQAVSVVMGTMIVGVVLMPDFTRYARGLRDCLTASLLGNGGGVILATCLAMVPSLVYASLDPMSYLSALGAGSVVLAVLVFATWTTNGANLYSIGLVVGSASPRIGYGEIILATGLVGTLAAIVGVAEYLLAFLEILAFVVPPVAGVYLTRWFVLRRRDFDAARLAARPAVVPAPMLATVISATLAALAWGYDWSLTGVVAFESLLLAAALYLLLDRLLPEAGRGRAAELGR